MKMKLIKNNIAFCNFIILFVGLVTFKKNIILLQKKEFSLTKLIPKGFTYLSQTGIYCFVYYVGLLSYIIDNIAVNNNLPFAFSSLGINLIEKEESSLCSSFLNGREGKNNGSNIVLSKTSDLNGQEEFITINKNESEIEVLKLFREKEMFPLPTPSNFSVEEKDQKIEGKKWVELKPLLFNYLITKNNQNGIGLDLKNKKLLLSPLLLPTIIDPKLTLAEINGSGKLGNSSYNFNSYSNQSIFSLSSEGLNRKGNIVALGENKNWYLSEDLIKLISTFFKSIYCLISKPKFINTPDKIIIEILYFITIPDYKIFKWYNFIYNSSTDSNLKVKKQLLEGKEGKYIKRKNKSIKLILRKNNLIKKTLFKLNNTNITKLYFNKFIILFKLLSSYFKKPIEFNLIRLHKSNYDSNILAQLFYLILKKKNIRSAIHNLYSKNKFSTSPLTQKETVVNGPLSTEGKENESSYSIPAYISGLYIHIGGRLMREPIIPRKTTKKFEKGAIATGKVNFVDTARITKKNKKGAYTIKIAFAQNFMFK